MILALGDNLRTSARNQLSGKVAERLDGAVNTEVTVELTAGEASDCNDYQRKRACAGIKDWRSCRRFH